MKKIFSGIVLLCVFGMQKTQAQSLKNSYGQENNPGTITTTANTSYDEASKTKRFLLGEHYRKEWATSVDIELLYLDSVAGGLTPVKLGGGKQTKSLRLTAADGTEYVLRSVNKDPSKAIPRELNGTFAEDIVQDQISSSNPYAPIAVGVLSEAAGIYHTTPRIIYVPYQTALGEFNEEFANTLCLLEERPAGNQSHNKLVGYSKKVVNSEKLLEKIFSDPGHVMDEEAFVKARLFDMWIGDWDRHEDQWLWASFKEDDKTIYRPVPRDRDQAFANLDGLLPQVAARSWALRKTQNFDYIIRDINGLNMAGNFLDRNFTTRLTLNDWLKVVDDLQVRLTDDVIASVFKLMPPEIAAISGETTIAKLKKRRDDLEKYATEYYYFLSKEINIVGTDQREFFTLTRTKDGSSTLIVNKIDKDGKKSDVLFARTFNGNETKELRLYGLGGEDVFHIKGKADKAILVRVISGEGKDRISDESMVKGGAHKTKVYSNADESDVMGNEARVFVSNDTLKNNYNRKSFRYNWIAPQIAPGYNPDDGLYLGGGIIIKKQKFGKTPYGYMQSLKANYAFATGAYNFWYEGIFKEAIGKWDLNLDAIVNAPNYVLNYYGLGNETERNEDDKNYNRVRSNQVIISPSLVKQLGSYQTIEAGLTYNVIKIENTENRFVSEEGSKLDSNDFERKYFAGTKVKYSFNNTDNALYPTKGLSFNSLVDFQQNLEDEERKLVTFSSSASWYITFNSFTAAFRVGGATNIGDYEFYQANTLGGSENLRGYRRSRFAGKTSFYQNTELRFKLNPMQGYILRGNWGLLSFFDNGRVWEEGENSNKYHIGYGAGVWFMPYNKMAFTATYGLSEDDKLLSIRAGFFF